MLSWLSSSSATVLLSTNDKEDVSERSGDVSSVTGTYYFSA
jgi:hypothetical protein